jgi:hypothetical protein
MGALTMLNEMGDTTITWSSDRDAEMEKIIEKKMAEGVVFWIIEPRGARRPMEEFAEAKKTRRLAIPDEDFAKFVESGSGDVVKTPDAKVTRSRRSKVPAEIAKAESVAVRPMRGG